MPIVDIHAHIYPETIAAKAAQAVGGFYLHGMFGDGSVSGERGLLAASAGSSITHFVVHSVAVKAKTVESINTFIASECQQHPNFIGFMAMHQDHPDPEAEINRAVALGLRGIKLHPDTQEVNADDPRLMNIYAIAQAKKLPLIIHAGDYRYDYSHPRRIKKILRAFPDLVVNAAHFGGWSIFDIGFDTLEHENCFVDTSSSLGFVGLRHARELISLYGAKRVLFGADFPMWSPRKEITLLGSLGLTEEDFADITWHNAERFLGMKLS